MIIPLIVLSIGAIFSGYVFKEMFIGNLSSQNFWLESIKFIEPLSSDHPPTWFVISTPLLVIISIPVSYYLFIRNRNITNILIENNKPIYIFLKNKWYFDEIYDFIFIKTSKNIGLFFWKKIDLRFIDRFGPDGVSGIIKNFSSLAVKFQSGFIYQYAFIILLGFSLLLTFLILK